MSRARLLRQYLQDYNRKVTKADDIYKEQYGAYKAKADEYNAFVTSVKAGQQQAVGEYAPGSYTMLKGYTDDYGVQGLTALQADKQGNPQLAGALVDKLPDVDTAHTGAGMLQGQLNGVYLKNGDGTATFHTWDTGITTTDSGGGDGGSGFSSVQTGSPGWVATSYRARVMDNSGIVAPEQVAPKEPTFTLNQIKEMGDPKDDAAGIAKAQALGYSGNPRLVADQPASRNSAFANIAGDDPNNLKEKGVLARAVAGEI